MSPRNRALIRQDAIPEIPLGRAVGHGSGDHERRDRARNDGGACQCHGLQRPQSAIVANAARPLEQAHHARGAVPRHPGRGRSGAARQCGRGHGGRGRGVFPGNAHGGRAGAEECGPRSDQALRRRRQCAHQQQCLRHGTGRPAGARCRGGPRMGRLDLRRRLERHEQQHHALEPGGAAGPPRKMAELACRPHARHDQGQLSVRCRSKAHHPGSREPAGLVDSPGFRLGRVGGAARRRAVSRPIHPITIPP